MPVTLETIEKLPPKYKALAVFVIYLLLGYFYYFFLLQAPIEKMGNLNTKLSELEPQISEKEKLVALKDRYLQEINILKEDLKIALTKLPNERDIPELIDSVALAGKRTGLEFVLFEPKPPERKKPEEEKKAEAKPTEQKPEEKKAGAKAPPKSAEPEKFYEEIPVKVSVSGGFHNIALFFERVAKLPRIVNIEDISMGGVDVKDRGRLVNSSFVMKTYMFLEKKDEKSNK